MAGLGSALLSRPPSPSARPQRLWRRRLPAPGPLPAISRATSHVTLVEKLETFRRDALPPQAAALNEHLPAEYQESRAFRVTYSGSATTALCKDAARELQLELRERAAETLGAILR